MSCYVWFVVVVFFFKQKTAYERRISDWSSDVCSSDLVDLATLGWDDPQVYELLQRGDTVGVFQLESEGMRRTLSAVKPTCFEDIIALVSLYRPGPMDNI